MIALQLATDDSRCVNLSKWTSHCVFALLKFVYAGLTDFDEDLLSDLMLLANRSVNNYFSSHCLKDKNWIRDTIWYNFNIFLIFSFSFNRGKHSNQTDHIFTENRQILYTIGLDRSYIYSDQTDPICTQNRQILHITRPDRYCMQSDQTDPVCSQTSQTLFALRPNRSCKHSVQTDPVHTQTRQILAYVRAEGHLRFIGLWVLSHLCLFLLHSYTCSPSGLLTQRNSLNITTLRNTLIVHSFNSWECDVTMYTFIHCMNRCVNAYTLYVNA